MAKTTTKLLGLALAGASAYGMFTLGQCLFADDEAAGTQHVLNQFWIERIPGDSREMIQHLVLIDIDGDRLGATGRSSQWRHLVELFHYGLEGNRLSLFFPQERVRGKVTVKSWECEGEAPEPFELCLEISDGGHSLMLYSLEEWNIDPDNVEESLQEIRSGHPELATALSDVSTPMPISQDELDSYTEVGAADLMTAK
ncbi:MAG: hypothetical protein AAF799_41245 [Myxococcota bacterium]